MAWLLMTMLVLLVSGECCREKKLTERLKCLFFYVVQYVTISVLLNISVSVTEIISFSVSVSISVNEYITVV